jgi:hypothetical protein
MYFQRPHENTHFQQPFSSTKSSPLPYKIWSKDGLPLLGVVYTMDNEVVPRPCNICDWLLNSSPDHFGLHQVKNDRVTMEFEVPILRSTLFINMLQWVLQWERQKRCFGKINFKKSSSMAEKCCYNKILINIIFLGKTR